MDLMTLVARLTMDSSDYESKMNSLPNMAAGAGKLVSTALKTWIGVKAVGAIKNFAQQSIGVGQTFDSSMSQVAATLGKTVDDMNAEIGEADTAYGKFTGNLREFAMFMGQNTVFSATQAAQALNYMALAGYDTQKSMDMLPNVLNLAAAGNMDLARASDMVTDAESALGLQGDEVNQMVSQMAKAASRSNTSVEQLGDAILTVGGTARYMAGGTDRLTTVLGVMADNGIKGSEAGTHLRNMLMKLSSPTKEGSAWLERLGVSAFDAEGNMRDFAEFFPEMNAAMSQLTDEERLQALSDIFNARDVASANALLGTSVERWAQLGGEIANAGEAASEMSKTQLDNLAGDLQLFNSALEIAQITISDKLKPALRGFVQFGTSALQTLTDGFREGGLTGAVESFGSIVQDGAQKIAEGLPTFVELGMKLLGGIATGLVQTIPTIGDSLMKVGQLVFEKVVEIGNQLIETGIPLFAEKAPEIMQNIATALIGGMYSFTEAGTEMIWKLAEGLQTAIPQFLESALPIILQFVSKLRENAGELVGAGIHLILSIARGLIDALPSLIEYVPQIITNIMGIINDNVPRLLLAGLSIVVMLAQGLIQNIPVIIANMGNIVQAMLSVLEAINWLNIGGKVVTLIANGIRNLITLPVSIFRNLAQSIFTTFQNGFSWASLGQNVIHGIVNGIVGAAGAIRNAMLDIAKTAWHTVKSFFGIASPSKLMRDSIGRYIPEGMAIGIEANTDSVKSAMQGLNEVALDSLDVDPSANVGNATVGGATRDVTINVYGAEGQDVQELADLVADRLNRALRNEELVYA